MTDHVPQKLYKWCFNLALYGKTAKKKTPPERLQAPLRGD